MEHYIIRAAGYFLQARADIQLLLQQVELQDVRGLNFDELLQLTDRALTSIKAASRIYLRLVRLDNGPLTGNVS